MNSDKLLWVAIGAGLTFAYYSIPYVLQRVRSESFVFEDPDNSKRESEGLRQGAEEAQKTDTLRALAAGHSFELRNAAIKIVAARSIEPKVRRLLLRDLACKDDDRRDNAINGLWLLLYHAALQEKQLPEHFTDRQSFSALITALVNVLALHQRSDPQQRSVGYEQKFPESKLPPSPLRPPNRPAHEVSLLIILHLLLIYRKTTDDDDQDVATNNVDVALSAGLITRWLTHYPFPCALPENAGFNYTKSDVTALFDRKAWASDDPLMYEIMRIILQSKNGRRQLYNAGFRSRWRGEEDEKLSDHSRQSSENGFWVDRDVLMEGGESTAGIVPHAEVWDGLVAEQAQADAGDLPRPRSRQRSHEEEMLHRRRRETVVVAEPGAPLSRDNIHEPILSPLPRPSTLSLNQESNPMEENRSSTTPPTIDLVDENEASGRTARDLRRVQAPENLERPLADRTSFRHRVRHGMHSDGTGSTEHPDEGPAFTGDPEDDNDLDAFMQQLSRAARDMDVADIREIMRRANYSPEQLRIFLSGAERAEYQAGSSRRTNP